MPAISRLKNKSLLLIISTLYFLSVLPGLSIIFLPGTPFSVFYATPIYRLPEFLIGVCMLILYKRATTKTHTITQVSVIFGFIMYIGTFGRNMPSYIGHNAVTIPVIAFMLFSLANNKGFFARLLW